MIKMIGTIVNSKDLGIKGRKQNLIFFQDSAVASIERKFVMCKTKLSIDDFNEKDNITEILNIKSFNDALFNNTLGNLTIIGSFTIHKAIDSFIYRDIRYIMNYSDNYKYYSLNDLFIDKKYRNKGYGSAFLNYILPKVIKINHILYTKAGASTLEYKTEPSERQYDKIINKVTNFYSKNNFISFNKYSQLEYGNPMIYANNQDVISNVQEILNRSYISIPTRDTDKILCFNDGIMTQEDFDKLDVSKYITNTIVAVKDKKSITLYILVSDNDSKKFKPIPTITFTKNN